MIRRLLYIAILLLLVIKVSISQNLNTLKIDSLFAILAENNQAMGSVAISKNGVEVYSKAIGYSLIDGDKRLAATPQTIYRIGSITKTFTATLIFQLIDERKLALTTTLDKFFPTVTNASTITIGNLLNHRSGIYNFTNDPSYLTYYTQSKSPQEMVAIISKYKSDFEPGTKYSYSNSNYLLLGFIIEKITKKSYAAILKKRITSKLNLTHTYVGSKIDVTKNESYSYHFIEKWIQPAETSMTLVQGAGALVSTSVDLTKFITALFANKLISKASLQQMKTLTDGYGMGLFQVPFGERRAFAHNGLIDGFNSMLLYFPDDNLSVAYLSNGQVYSMNDILIGVLSIYYNKSYKLPDFKPTNYIAENLDAYPGVYSSPQFPLKITIAKLGNSLSAQATGQMSFPLEAVAKDIFKFEGAGIVIEFNNSKNELILKQRGAKHILTKEN
jgi:D-alanyl-D-alanine carboxypeptidase